MTSSNPRALRSFLEKLPKKLRALALDMSCCKEDGMLEFQQALETLYKNFQTPKKCDGKQRLRKFLTAKKDELQELLENIKLANEAKRLLVADDELADHFRVALELSTKAPWLVKSILAKDLDLEENINVFEKIQNDANTISFGAKDDGDILDDAFLELVEKKANGVPKPFKPNSALSESEKRSEENLSLVRLDGKCPISQADWQCVLAAAKFRKECIPPLLERGCTKEDIFDGSRATFRADFIAELKKGLALRNAIDALHEGRQQVLRFIVEDASYGRETQDQCRKLEAEIQMLEAELLYVQVVAALKEKLDYRAMSTLKTLCLKINKLNSGALSSTTTSERTTRHFESFTQDFKEAAKFMPLLVMLTDQVSTCLPPDHQFDVGIMDESSQSNCTAITIMARCKQFLAVGDDKQVSPSQIGLSEERIRGLKVSLPAIPTAEQLLPEYSFFDLFQAAFPRSTLILSEHYRCDPRIIAISNELWYFSELIPLRLASHSSAIQNLSVKGVRDSARKINQVEAERISDCVFDEVESTAEKTGYQTIGVISLGGPQQCKLIKQLIGEKIDPLIEKFGPEVVDRHKILVGTPKEFQGDERDIIYLSAVYSLKTNSKDSKEVRTLGNSRDWDTAVFRQWDL